VHHVVTYAIVLAAVLLALLASVGTRAGGFPF
jgi:hypothetical protein